jgi:hypothetical protein
MRVEKVCGRNVPAAVVMRSVRFERQVAVSAALNIRIHCRSRPNPVATAVPTAGSSSCYFLCCQTRSRSEDAATDAFKTATVLLVLSLFSTAEVQADGIRIGMLQLVPLTRRQPPC